MRLTHNHPPDPLLAIEYGGNLDLLEGPDMQSEAFQSSLKEARKKQEEGVKVKPVEDLPYLELSKRKRRKKCEILEMRKNCI